MRVKLPHLTPKRPICYEASIGSALGADETWRDIMDGPQSTPRPPLRELQHIRLRDNFESPDGCIAAGTLGTILQVFDQGRAYQIEFEGPYDIPETVPEHLVVAERAAES